MYRISQNRSTALYYFAWRLSNERETSEISRRLHLRNTSNPMDVSDTDFKKSYRLSKNSFKLLCQELRSKTNLKSSKRISLELKVLCALSFFATGSYQHLVGMSKNVAQSTISKYLGEVTDALNHPNMANTYIKFPTTAYERELIKQKFYRKYRIPGVCGCIDGSHFRIFTPKKNIEHLFYSRKHFHSINVQIVCDSDCRILNVNAKYGGATHDAFIWDNSSINEYMQQLHQNNEKVWLLGDSAYPLRPWLMTPIADAVEGSPEAYYTEIHGKARVVIENTFGRLKNRWRCLHKDRTLHFQPEKCAKIVIACCVLHNFSLPDSEEYDPSDGDGEVDGATTLGLTEETTLEATDYLNRGRAIRNRLVVRINNSRIM